MISFKLSSLVVAVILALSCTEAIAAPRLSLSVSAPLSVDGVENLKVQTTVTNTGDEAVTLLKDPNTILTDHNTEAFSISHANGNGSPQFTGIRVKYSANAIIEHNVKEGILVLEPGKSYTVEHPFAGTYDFSKTGEGDYDLAVNSMFTTVSPNNDLSSIQAETNNQPTRVSLSGTLSSTSKKLNTRSTLNATAVSPNHYIEGRIHSKRVITFVGCAAGPPTQQQAIITQAATDATMLITQSANYLQGLMGATPRWTTWFGTYTDARRMEALSYFTRINAANAPSNTQYNCNCADPTLFAQVDPLTPGQVTLCPLFFAAPPVGTDSRAGTIVHENTHFVRYGGAIDVVNTQTQATCRTLAINNPFAAILNANNIEYFAENTPALV